jgi:hypothetical protein
MRPLHLLLLAVLLLSLLGCQRAPSTLPASAQPTPLSNNTPSQPGAVVNAPGQSSPGFGSVPTPGGPVIALANVLGVLQMSKQYDFSTGTVAGQPATFAKLNGQGAASFPAVADGLSIELIGDPNNLSSILITIPRSDNAETAQQGLSAASVICAGLFPPDKLAQILAWLNQSYIPMTVSGKEQTKIQNVQMTLERDASSMILEIVPLK